MATSQSTMGMWEAVDWCRYEQSQNNKSEVEKNGYFY
jgi:hypothetical protein